MKQHVHFIGICGKATAPVARMFLDLNWRVTGSDKGFFPPVSDYLKKYPEIGFYPGWHPDRIGQPDLVVIGNFIGLSNPEFKFVRENNLPYKSWPEVLEEFLIKKNSIVVAGTFGKTTLAALITWILDKANYEPSYLSAGIQKNFPDGVRLTKSNWSVVEGDEYPAGRWFEPPRAKFSFYHPRYLLLTSAAWDHMDVFETEQSYIDVYKELVREMPSDGLIIANQGGEHLPEILKQVSCRVIYYQGLNRTGGTSTNYQLPNYQITNKKREGDTVKFTIKNQTKTWQEEFQTILIGNHMLENICGAVALSTEIGVSVDCVKEGVASFKGVGRRLEVRGQTSAGAIVIDDLGHTPLKAQASLAALKDWYTPPQSHLYQRGDKKGVRIIAVYEPNVGARTEVGLDAYENAFKDADEVIVPRLSKTKRIVGEKRLDGEELVEVIRKSHTQARYIPHDDKLACYLRENARQGDVVAFMGAHGFRNMIEQVMSD